MGNNSLVRLLRINFLKAFCITASTEFRMTEKSTFLVLEMKCLSINIYLRLGIPIDFNSNVNING